MIRYEAREATDTGWGRRFWTDRLWVLEDIVSGLPNPWRIRRQVRWPGDVRWHLDGPNAEWWME